MPPLNRPDVLIDVLEEHLEELDFLCEHREQVLFDPDWDLADLAQLESRMEAHLDGLMVGEGHSNELARKAIGEGRLSLAAAASLALLSLSPDSARSLVRSLPQLEPEAALGVRIALCHSVIDAVVDDLTGLLEGAPPLFRAVAADALAFHRRLPEHTSLDDLLVDEDPLVVRTGLCTVARTARTLAPEILERGLASGEAAVREATLRAASVGRHPGLPARCREIPSPESIRFLGVIGGDAVLPLLERSLGEPEWARSALMGLAALGSVPAIELLLRTMDDAALQRTAGAGFTRITGADIQADEPPSPPPEGAGEAELDDFDDSPLPDPARAAAFWQAEGGRFQSAPRWQAGRDVSNDVLAAGFDDLPLAIRLDLYLGARFSDPAAPLMELEARARVQLGRAKAS